MQSVTRRPDGSSLLTVSGSMDVAAAERLGRLLTPAIGPGTRLVIDMSEVSYLCPKALDVLAGANARVQAEHGVLAIAIGERRAEVLRTVEASRLQRTLRLFDTVEHALAAALPPPTP